MYILGDYDKTLEKIINNGIKKSNRTNIDTLTLISPQCRYRIDERFPIPTKRKAFYKSIFAELLWMLSGSTNVNDLNKLGSKIWDFWKDSEFEKRNGYEDGDLGPIYGNSFINFGGDYKQKNGFNQLLMMLSYKNVMKIQEKINRTGMVMWLRNTS